DLSALLLASEGEPALRRHLLATLRDERGRLQRQRDREVHDLVVDGQLEVHAGPGRLDQEPHVPVLDVAPILAQMNGDPVRAAELRQDRGPHRVRLVRPPRLANRCHVIDVDVESHYSKDRSASSSAALRASSPAAFASSSASRPSAEYSVLSFGDNRARWRRTVSTSPRAIGPVSAA